ncbi:MAG: DUF2807 domain-containing protein [Bacteroidales bacterium]|jgi:phage shock protein PspC (stress-responsive transcriptional regulator)|nr:DUF2807 domain-containing protein [Bacteroidales bacterium]
MKTSININLFGTLYAIDEDAHQLLQQYLASMKSYFSRQEGGDEISDDIEHRVAELFWELKQNGCESISIEQVKSIIQEIGNPEELGEQQSGNESRSTDGRQQTTNDGQQSTDDTQRFSQKVEDTAREAGSKAKVWLSKRRYYRDPQDKLVGGVLSGLAHYFGGGDPIVWRLLFALLTFFSGFFPAILIYILIWLCAPEARTAEERLRMQGKEVNPENIKSQVLSYGEDPTIGQQNRSGCLGSTTGFLAVCFKILLVLLAIPGLFVIAIIVFALFVALLAVIGALFGAATGISVGGVSLGTALLAGEKWTLIACILSALAFIALGIYTLYRIFHRDRTPFSGLTLTILLGLMLLSALICWQGGRRISNKLHDFDWTTISPFDGTDDDEDFSNYRDSVYVVSPFNEVDVQGIARVIYRQADSCSVSVKGSEWLHKHTIIEENDGRLTISQDDQLGKGKNNISRNAYRIYVTAPYITNLKMRGIGSIEFEGDMQQEQPINVEMEGIGMIDIDKVTCPKLNAVNKGAGMVKIEAYVDSLIVHNKGIGAIEIEGRTFNYQRNNDGIGSINDNELKIGM